MEVLEIFFTAVNNHIGELITLSFLIFLAIAIASVFVKNKQEYETIVSDLYYDKRKRTPLIKKTTEKKYIGNYQSSEELEEESELEDDVDKDGYEVETHRDTIRETAAWEDTSVEKKRNRENIQQQERLMEYERVNKIMMEQNKQKEASRDIGQEITKMLQEKMQIQINIERAKNKAIGVNSSQSNNKFKKLAEKGKLKVNKKTPVGKQIAKAQEQEKKRVKHAQKEVQRKVENEKRGMSL